MACAILWSSGGLCPGSVHPIRVACAALWSSGGLCKASAQPIRVACAVLWSSQGLCKASAQPIRMACATLCTSWADRQSQPEVAFGAMLAIGEANLRGPRNICGHLGYRQGPSGWPARHPRPLAHAISFGPPTKPTCVTCAVVAVVWATVNATPRGLPRLGGHPGHRRGHSAWPAEYSRPFMRPAKLICIACAMLWSTGGLHKASAESFRVGLALARHRATCAAMWAPARPIRDPNANETGLERPGLRSTRGLLGHRQGHSATRPPARRVRQGVARAALAATSAIGEASVQPVHAGLALDHHLRPLGPSARSRRNPNANEHNLAQRSASEHVLAQRGPSNICGHVGHHKGSRAKPKRATWVQPWAFCGHMGHR